MILLDNFPILAIYFVGVAVLLLVSEIGYRIGLWVRARYPDMGKNRVTGSLVGGLIGLMAFLLALTIGTVINHHNERKAMVVTEANAIGTAYLQAGFLAEPDRSSTRDLLQDYVQIRLAVAPEPELLEASMVRSEEIHSELWAIVEENVWQGRESAIMALFVDSINEVIDVHTLRITAFQRRLPRNYGIMLMVTAMLSFFLVGIVGSADKNRGGYLPILLFALAFMAVFMLVADLDRPLAGQVTVSQQALTDLLRQMEMSG